MCSGNVLLKLTRPTSNEGPILTFQHEMNIWVCNRSKEKGAFKNGFDQEGNKNLLMTFHLQMIFHFILQGNNCFLAGSLQ